MLVDSGEEAILLSDNSKKEHIAKCRILIKAIYEGAIDLETHRFLQNLDTSRWNDLV